MAAGYGQAMAGTIQKKTTGLKKRAARPMPGTQREAEVLPGLRTETVEKYDTVTLAPLW